MHSEMKKLLFISLAVILFNIPVMAKGEPDSKFTFGVEWGYIASVHSGYHYNFFAPEGYRVDDYGSSLCYISNVDTYFFAGRSIGKQWNMELFAGYAGVADIHEVIPISIRATRFFGEDETKDRWFTFIDAGSGISIKRPVQEIFVGKIGGGYRMALSRDTGLNFICALRMTYTHPEITYDKQVIDMDMVNRNNAYVTSLSVGLSLSF